MTASSDRNVCDGENTERENCSVRIPSFLPAVSSAHPSCCLVEQPMQIAQINATEERRSCNASISPSSTLIFPPRYNFIDQEASDDKIREASSHQSSVFDNVPQGLNF